MFTQLLHGFLNEIFISNEKERLERIYLLTTVFKEDTNMFSFEFEEGFGLRLWLYNKALIDQLARSIRESIRTLVFCTDRTKNAIRIFSRMDLTTGQ